MTDQGQDFEQSKPSVTEKGFELDVWQRIACLVLGVALILFGCFSMVWDEPNAFTVTPLVLGVALFVVGLVGRLLRRATYRSPTIGEMDLVFGPATSASTRESPPGQTAPPPPTPAEADLTPVQIVVTDQGVGVDTVEVEKHEPLDEALEAYDDKEYARFDSKMREAIAAETSDTRRVGWDAYRLERLYTAGQPDRLQELKALRDKHPKATYPVIALGNCYGFAGEHEQAAAVYGEGYEIDDLDSQQRVTFLSRQAKALRAAKLFEKAEECLAKGAERAATDGEKAEVELLLAELYEDWDHPNEMFVHFEEAVNLNPGNEDARFKLAYRYNKAGYKLAAFHHYDMLRRQRNGPSTLNNLAIILSELDMPITMARFYLMAWEQKEPLAAANLAETIAQAGLVGQAKGLLTEARKVANSHERIDGVSLNVAKWEQSEKDRLKQIREAGEAERSLALKRFEAESQQLSPLKPEDIEGTWTTSVGDMTFEKRDRQGHLVARFKDRYWDWELVGEVSGRTFSFQWMGDTPGQNQKGDGFLVFRTDSEFEGIIRHTPAKGEARLVNGNDRMPPLTPSERPEPPSPRALAAEFLGLGPPMPPSRSE